MNTLFDVVIVANGEFPLNKIPLEILRNAKHIIACDGAIRYVPQAEIVIGDGDSVPTAFHDRLIHIDEQEDNDLTKATRYCLSQGWHKIAYLGGTGKREDHTLGNISLLMRYYKEMGIEGRMFTDYGVFTPAQGTRAFPAVPGQQVSIFNFGCTKIESVGLKWQSYAFEEWWQGTLNESVGNSFTLCADGYYMVFQTYEGK